MALQHDNTIQAFIRQLADASAEVIRPYFRQANDIVAKDDNSPVTIADKEAEKVMRTLIETHYPEHGIIGEEYGNIHEDSPYQWVLDPIDGTASFMIGRPIFGTLIALCYQGVPILGVINQPILNERWIGTKGDKAVFEQSAPTTNEPAILSPRQCEAISQAILCTTSPQYFATEDIVKFGQLAYEARYTIYGGDCYNYALLASGHVDVVVESGLQPYDYCALVAVVEAAGGMITDWQGNPLTLESKGHVVAAATAKLHEQLLTVLSG